jgi:hypothetical protein
VGRTCGMHGGGESCLQGRLGGLKGRDCWEDQGTGRRIILKWTLGK